jgi:hypothetical protein
MDGVRLMERAFCARSLKPRYLTLVIALFCCTSAWSYKLVPVSAGESVADELNASQTERLQALREEGKNRSDYLTRTVKQITEDFSSPVHEIITNKIYGCSNDECKAPTSVIDGLKWNDNPTFHQDSHNLFCVRAPRYIDIVHGTSCWLALFDDAYMGAHMGKKFSADVEPLPALIYRVHFGDLQFLHSMASWDDENAIDTHEHILAWAEYTYRVADGEILSPDIDSPIAIIQPNLAPMFKANGYSTRSLFAPTHPKISEPQIREMAFGSLLHMVEDSFSKAHVNRDINVTGEKCNALNLDPAPGVIHGFYAYNHQGRKHGDNDTLDVALHQEETRNNPFQVGTFLRISLKDKKWAEVKPLFECLYNLTDKPDKAGPGRFSGWF